MSSSDANLTFCIAIPIYGQADLLPTALASLAAQKVNLNIAIMDASVDDAAQDILNMYCDLPITYRRHGPDAGQAAAIQEGWSATQSDVLSWLNADDYLVPGGLEIVEDIFKSNPHVDVVYGDAIFVDREGRFNTYFPSISEDISDIRFHNCISQPACFIRRVAVERVHGVNTKLHYIMDWDLWTRLYLSGAIFYYVQRPLAAVRMYAETKTSSGGRDRLVEIFEHLKKHASPVKRVKSMIAFAVDAGDCGLVLRSIIGGYSIGRRFISGLISNSRVKQVYGMEVRSNRIYDEGRIYLPWYGECPVRKIEVVARTQENIGAVINNNSLVRQSIAYSEGDMCLIVFKVPDELASDNFFDIRLRSDANKHWILLSVSVH